MSAVPPMVFASFLAGLFPSRGMPVGGNMRLRVLLCMFRGIRTVTTLYSVLRFLLYSKDEAL